MSIILSFLFGLLFGAVGGALAYRNNQSKVDGAVASAKAAEAKVGKAIDDLKK